MDAQYRKLNGTPVPHLANYAKSYLRAHPEVSLSVGTDSQNIGGSSVYATVVAFRHPGKGVWPSCFIIDTTSSDVSTSELCWCINPSEQTSPLLAQ